MAKGTSERTVNWILGSILMVVLIAVGGFAVHRADAVKVDLDEHSATDGHPKMVERMTTARQDIVDIRHELGVIRARQDDQTDILNKIDRNVQSIKTGHE